MMHKFLGGTWVSGYGDVAQLVLRAALGIIFVWHGWDKIANTGIPGVAGFLGSLGIPLPELMAYVLAYGELVAGTLLIVGLFTYLAAKFAVVVGIVAFFTVHLKNGFVISNGGYEYILLIFAAAVSLLITGAGKYSLDAMWWKKDRGGMM